MSTHPFSVSASPAWTAAGWTMLHLVWTGAACALVVALLRQLLRPSRPEIRHAVAVACLLALTASPFVLFAWLYRPDPATASAIERAGRVATPAGRATVHVAPTPVLELRSPRVEPPAAVSLAPVSSRFEPLVGYLPGLWLSGSLGTLVLLATGLVGVERLRRSSLSLESGPISERCRVLAASLGVARRVGVAICDRLAAPVLIGVVRPLILLPPAALSGWSMEQVEMALLHELTHIRRRDNLVTLLQRLAESLLFFHPVTWWLSSWVSLERELCCDRLVVEHTGQPHAYARMLAALAGASPGARSPALAMAERPLTTRIRRILDMEDRSMRMTLTEGLGLLAAAVVGTTLTLATQAGPPKPGTDDAARLTLDRMAERVVALPDGREGYGDKGSALLSIAEAQLKLGDRAAALATLRRLDGLADPSRSKPEAKGGLASWGRFASLVGSVKVRRDAGDVDGARAALARAARDLEIFDANAIRGAFERMSKDMNSGLAKKPEQRRVLNDEEAAYICEASVGLIPESIALGDTALARTLIRRTVAAIGPVEGPAKALFAGALGGYLVKAGDPDGGRDLIKQARLATLKLTDPEGKAFAVPHLAGAMAEAGDLDEALAMVREMSPTTQQAALGRILGGIMDDTTRRVPWLDLAGVNLKIADPWLSPKDPVLARSILPKIADAVRASGDAKMQARTLAIVALLQARAGDFPGALTTARSIPVLKRSDFPGPSDGFYDAVKPATFGLIAGVQSEAGDRSAATVAFGEAEALARAVEAEDQKLIAQIVIAQQYAACGRRDAANAVVKEAVPLALTQPEPRRSRVLTMLAEAQVQAADAAGALRTIDTIRDFPGLEKARALAILARRHEQAGNATTSEALIRRAVACLESKAPETPLPGKVLAVSAFGRDTFVDFDLELAPGLVNLERDTRLQTFRTRIGDVDAAVRASRALPPERRNAALSTIASSLAHRGDLTGALDLAASIESPDARLNAFRSLAFAISDGQSRK